MRKITTKIVAVVIWVSVVLLLIVVFGVTLK